MCKKMCIIYQMCENEQLIKVKLPEDIRRMCNELMISLKLTPLPAGRIEKKKKKKRTHTS